MPARPAITPDQSAPDQALDPAAFSAATRAWFEAAFAAPTPAQAQAWAAIGRGENTLVIAPTGSGKTLAAFLWAIDKLASDPVPADPRQRCRVLYVSPLKALAVDVQRNLRSPLTGIGHAARRLGLPEPDIRVGVRTGDTAAEERRKLAGKPPDILITTPESLYLMLTSRARETLRSVQTVIVDEVHALAGGKRGAHLALSLERLDALRAAAPDQEPGGAADARPEAAGVPGEAGQVRPVQRIGLSATVRPPQEVASFLGGALPVSIVTPPSTKELDLQIVVPVEDMADLQAAGAPDSVLGAPGPSARSGPAGARPGGGGRAGPAVSGGPGVAEADGFGPPATDPVRQHSIWPHVEERVLDLIMSHRSTIVFANSRRLAERLCARLNELAAERIQEQLAEAGLTGGELGGTPAGSGTPAGDAGHRADPAGGGLPDGALGSPAQLMAQAGAGSGATPIVARAHHGSVSRQERTQIEEALKAGRLPAVVATSSLELGIDMGAVDLVIQVESPPSVASGLQRTGRAGHNVGDVSRGVFFPKYQGDLVQATVVVQRMQAGQIEELRMPRNPLDVLAQQIVAMTAMDDWEVGELERTVRRAAPFSGLTRAVLEAVLDMLAGLYPSEDFGGLRPRLVWDRTTGILRGRPGGQRVAVGNAGTIPDRGMFGVFLAGGQRDRSGRHSRRVGELDEEMVYESRVGDVFVLGASSWRIEDITADQVLVSPAPGQPGKLPFWHGDAPGRPAELGAAIGAFTRELTAVGDEAAMARLRADGLDELAASNLIAYFSSQREATGYLPDDRTLVVERFRDELGDWRIVLHSPYGGQVHAPWALAIAARLRERYGGMDVQAIHTDDGIVIRVPDADDPPPAGIAMLDPDEVEQVVTAELGSSAMFASRFRECAARALLLPRRQPGRRTPLWQQRQRAAQLLSVASQYGTFPIVLETVRECLQDVFDVPGLTRLMRDLAARRIRLVEVETPGPSPFSRSILFRYIGAFMYEGDAPLAERRAQALALDSALLADLLGQADMRELLDPLVVTEMEQELQRLAPGRRCRNAEAVADMLRSLGPLSTAETAACCADPAAAEGWLAELAAQRRVISVRIAGQERWAAIEDAGRLRDALGVALPPGVPDVFTEPVADPLRDLVVRYARTHGPFTAIEVAERYGLGVAVVTGALHRLAAEGSVAEGEFRPDGQGTEWCEAGVLRALRRRCLAKIRKEVEPAPVTAFAAFLPAWQHAGQALAALGRGSLSGRRAAGRSEAQLEEVYEAVDQLSGAAVPASALETLILPGRVPGYAPALLDELTSAGDVVWAGAGALPGGDGWLVLAPAETAPLLLPEPGEITTTPVHAALLAVLDGGGALFFRTLADRVAALLAAGQPGDPLGSAGSRASDQAVASAIWDLVWAGRLSNDTLGPLRTVLSSGRPVAPGPPGAPGGRAARAATGSPDSMASVNGTADGSGTSASGPVTPGNGSVIGARPPAGGGLSLGRRGRGTGRRPSLGRATMPSRSGPPTVSGRWSLLPSQEPDSTRRRHAQAIALLERHGIVLRGAVAAERIPGGFSAIYPVLRAMEEGGQCRRGYFVEGMGAAQFALPGAVDRMRALAESLSAHDASAGQAPPSEPDWNMHSPASSGADRAAADEPAWAAQLPRPAGSGAAGESAWTASPASAGESAWSSGAASGGPSPWNQPSSSPASAGWLAAPGWSPDPVVDRRPEPPVQVLAAADPANAYGAALPWPERPEETAGGHRPGRKAGALVVISRGELILYVERGGKTLLSWSSDPAILEPAARALAAAGRAGALGRLTVERADGDTVYESPLAQALESAGFRPTPRGLRLRG